MKCSLIRTMISSGELSCLCCYVVSIEYWSDIFERWCTKVYYQILCSQIPLIILKLKFFEILTKMFKNLEFSWKPNKPNGSRKKLEKLKLKTGFAEEKHFKVNKRQKSGIKRRKAIRNIFRVHNSIPID